MSNESGDNKKPFRELAREVYRTFQINNLDFLKELN